MMTELPAPLTPKECDLRDMDGFMLNSERLLASELWALANGEEFKAAVGLWCRAWKQIPAASLPNDDRVLASFANVSTRTFRKIKSVAMRGFVECSDGRLYHKVLAEDALRAWEKKKIYRERSTRANARRWSRDYLQHEPTSSEGIQEGSLKDEKTDPTRSQDASNKQSYKDASSNQEGAIKDSYMIPRDRDRDRDRTVSKKDSDHNPELLREGVQGESAKLATLPGVIDPGPLPTQFDRSKSKPKRRTALNGEWVIRPNDARCAYAKTCGMSDAELAVECDKFENHHRAKGSIMADWDAAWRTWCRNWQTFKTRARA